MGLTSEQVHWIFGSVLVAAAALMLVAAWRKASWRGLDYVIPVLLMLMGAELILDPWVHGSAAPAGYASETRQHALLGGLLIATSLIELVRVRRGSATVVWRVPLAAALLIAAGLFFFHAQHDSNAPMALLMIQHRMIGATLGVMALAALLDGKSESAESPGRTALALLVMLLGLQLLIYTEGSAAMGPGGAHPAMESMR